MNINKKRSLIVFLIFFIVITTIVTNNNFTSYISKLTAWMSGYSNDNQLSVKNNPDELKQPGVASNKMNVFYFFELPNAHDRLFFNSNTSDISVAFADEQSNLTEFISRTATNNIPSLIQSNPCVPPSSGNWILSSSCTLNSSFTVNGNVLVRNNSILTISPCTILGVNFFSSNITVQSGSGILIKSGGTIKNNPSNDLFGIKKIYPTKSNGNTWFMDMTNPAADPRFDPQLSIVQNPDCSWKINSNNDPRMSVYATDRSTYLNNPILNYSRTALANNGYMQFPSDWKNFEMTGYVKLNSGTNDAFTWYGRGGEHSSAFNGCEGSSYKADLKFSGGTQFAKESWHVKYDQTTPKFNTPSLLNKWIGFKFVVYNSPGIVFPQKAIGEIWVDLENNNQWLKVDSFVDDGFGSGANHCGPATADNMPITWGGPIVAFRVDNSKNFDFKFLSVREIEPPN